MVPDLMPIQDYGKIPTALLHMGSAQNSQQKEAKKGDSRQRAEFTLSDSQK